MASNPTFRKVPIRSGRVVMPASTTAQAVMTADATAGSDLTNLYIISNNASSVVMEIILDDGSNSDVIGTVTIPAAGGVVQFVRANQDNLYSGLNQDAFGNYYYRLKPVENIKVRCQTAPTASVIIVHWKSEDLS